ncbi:MAG: hypothetical protein II878_00995 [Bacteroidales bacterium]|nr:hypothetical protein [Bacteroidales bacterium]
MNIFITLDDNLRIRTMMKKDTLEIKNNDALRVEEFIEGICADNHLHNYMGSISVAISTALSLSQGDITLCFEKCVGGVCFTIKTEKENNFSSLVSEDTTQDNEFSFLINALTDEIEVKDEGKTLDLIFYVSGIDEELAMRRKELLHEYSLNVLKFVTK